MTALDLSGKRAIVTGASSGIGKATAAALAGAGVRVAGGARRVERLETEVALELTEQPTAFARAHLELARRNLSDLEPPRLVYLLLFSHPTAPERLAVGRAWRAVHP